MARMVRGQFVRSIPILSNSAEVLELERITALALELFTTENLLSEFLDLF